MSKSKLILATSLFVAVSAAYADSGDVDISQWSGGPSAASREQVKQEMRDAYARGEITYGEQGYGNTPSASTRSRAEVVAEMREASSLGLLSAIGEGDVPVATAEQERLIAKAGQDAAGRVAIATAGVRG
jgi:hypothetical protein